jgi:hypothetical protein
MYILSITTVHLTRIDTGTFKYTHSKIYYLVLNTIKQTNMHMCTFPLYYVLLGYLNVHTYRLFIPVLWQCYISVYLCMSIVRDNSGVCVPIAYVLQTSNCRSNHRSWWSIERFDAKISVYFWRYRK